MFGGLRSFVLNLLYEKPLRGSEIIEAIGSKTMGWWRPSPGSIYPLLSKLEEEGYIIKDKEGRYELTQQGKDELGVHRSVLRGFSPIGRPSTVEEMLTEMDSYLDYFSDVSNEMSPQKDKLKELSKRLSEIIEKIE